MANDQHNILDTKVKETLSNLEMPFDAGHWAEMDAKLGAQPAASVFSNWKFSLNIAIILVAVGTALFFVFRPSSQKKEKKKPAATYQAPTQKEPLKLTNIDEAGNVIPLPKDSTIPVADPGRDKTAQTEEAKENEVVLGDQLDKKKGIVKERTADTTALRKKKKTSEDQSRVIRTYEDEGVKSGVPLETSEDEGTPFATDTATTPVKKDSDEVKKETKKDSTRKKRRRSKDKFGANKTILDP